MLKDSFAVLFASILLGRFFDIFWGEGGGKLCAHRALIADEACLSTVEINVELACVLDGKTNISRCIVLSELLTLIDPRYFHLNLFRKTILVLSYKASISNHHLANRVM